MQCPSCQFENMPGSSHCARCAASLTLATADLDVHPPRASRLERKLSGRTTAMIRRSLEACHVTVGSVFGITDSSSNFGGTWKEYLWLFVPGLNQWKQGEVGRTRLFFGVFAGLLLLTLLLAGSVPGSMLLGALFSWHVMATVDAIARNFAKPSDRFSLTLVCAACVFLLLYFPALSMIRRAATPITIGQASRYFEPGNVVWYHPTSRGTPGDLVLYDIPTITATPRAQTLYPIQYRIAGLRINRLVAVGGQQVQTVKGELLVDGTPSPWQPATRSLLPDGIDMKLRPEQVLILPEDLLPGVVTSVDPETAMRLGLMSQSGIQGVVLARTFPLYQLRLY